MEGDGVSSGDPPFKNSIDKCGPSIGIRWGERFGCVRVNVHKTSVKNSGKDEEESVLNECDAKCVNEVVVGMEGVSMERGGESGKVEFVAFMSDVHRSVF